MQNVKLANGVEMPVIGYGTWRTPDETVGDLVYEAIRAGYRHIDTAAKYGNESGVGKGIARAIKDGLVTREELFVTTKVWNFDRGYGRTKAAFERSMKELGLTYLDLYLIHWPAAAHQYECWKELNGETWRAMEDLYRQGRVRAIGVSNFRNHHLQPLMQSASVKPMVNQIEIHPGLTQQESVRFGQENGVQMQAWSPLGTGRMVVNEQLIAMAAKYGKTSAQLCLRWLLQQGIVPLPKSWNPERMAQNLDVFSFELMKEDMEAITSMSYFGGSGEDPDQILF